MFTQGQGQSSTGANSQTAFLGLALAEASKVSFEVQHTYKSTSNMNL
jgi:hypothetical protein